MISFPWRQHLNLNTDPNWQVKAFTTIFLNIMSNFITNEKWIKKSLKPMLNKKYRLFRNCKSHGYKTVDKVRLDAFRIECQQAAESAKLVYLTKGPIGRLLIE